MNPKLAKRVSSIIQKVAKENKWSKKIVARINKKVREDLILPCLSLKANAKVTFTPWETDVNTFTLTIGDRDLEFDAKTGECVGSGTLEYNEH